MVWLDVDVGKEGAYIGSGEKNDCENSFAEVMRNYAPYGVVNCVFT